MVPELPGELRVGAAGVVELTCALPGALHVPGQVCCCALMSAPLCSGARFLNWTCDPPALNAYACPGISSWTSAPLCRLPTVTKFCPSHSGFRICGFSGGMFTTVALT